MKYNLDSRAQRLIDIFDLGKGQINISIVNSIDHVVGFHQHKLQTDFFYCVKGSFQVCLATDRPPDKRHWFEYISDRDVCKYIVIPPLTYHAYKALESGSIMLYYLTEKYNKHDEFRVPIGYFKEDWSIPNK